MVKKEKGIIDMFVDKIKKTSIVVVEDYIREKISKKIVNFLGKHTAYLIGFILIVYGSSFKFKSKKSIEFFDNSFEPKILLMAKKLGFQSKKI